jgi:hypothetical protein
LSRKLQGLGFASVFLLWLACLLQIYNGIHESSDDCSKQMSLLHIRTMSSNHDFMKKKKKTEKTDDDDDGAEFAHQKKSMMMMVVSPSLCGLLPRTS